MWHVYYFTNGTTHATLSEACCETTLRFLNGQTGTSHWSADTSPQLSRDGAAQLLHLASSGDLAACDVFAEHVNSRRRVGAVSGLRRPVSRTGQPYRDKIMTLAP
eukprot:8184803-Pyramimonas_sp.AAC.1